MEDFVASIAPASLICISRKNNEQKKFEKIQEFSTNLISLMHYQQKGYAILAEKYTRPWNFSKEYTDLRVISYFPNKNSLFFSGKCGVSKEIVSRTGNHANSCRDPAGKPENVRKKVSPDSPTSKKVRIFIIILMKLLQ